MKYIIQKNNGVETEINACSLEEVLFSAFGQMEACGVKPVRLVDGSGIGGWDVEESGEKIAHVYALGIHDGVPLEIRDIIRSKIEDVLDLRLLRGEIPWSLAGSDGLRRSKNLHRRGVLVARIAAALLPLGWSAEISTVRSPAGRANKLELVITSPAGENEVWTW